jgi:DNA polymerase-3 subunit epsilon
MRQIILDTETTGMSAEAGHRIIEIGAVEIVNRRMTGNNYQTYLNPKRSIDPGSTAVHGITNDDVADKPEFKEVMQEFLSFIQDTELLIHNAPFDTAFINHEFSLAGYEKKIEDLCEIKDTLPIARKTHPGKRNSLDALCSRYNVDKSNRELHGALIDAKLLGQVYLLMTGGQVEFFGANQNLDEQQTNHSLSIDFSERKIMTVELTNEDLEEHQQYLEDLLADSDQSITW